MTHKAHIQSKVKSNFKESHWK